jgi:hypothetical protein
MTASGRLSAGDTVVDHGGQESQRAYARVAGLFYLLVLAFDISGLVITSSIEGGGGFGQTVRDIVASQGLYRLGLCLALIGSMSTIPLAIGLYVTLKPVDGNLAMTALLFRTAEAVVGAVGIVGAFAVLQIYLQASHTVAFNADQLRDLIVMHPLGASTTIAAIFFSTGSTIFFYIFLRTQYIPRILSALGVFASVLYLAIWFTGLVAPGAPGLVQVLGSVPILIAEVSTGLWLLIAGIRT